MINDGLTPKEVRARAAERRRKRFENKRFIAKMRGLPVTPSKTLLKKEIRDLTSLIVRRRDRKLFAGHCLVCCAKARLGLANYAPEPITLAYHIVPCGDAGVAYNLDDIVGACFRCNKGELESRNKFSSRLLYHKIHIEVLGGGEFGEKRLRELKRLAATPTQLSTMDLLVLRDERKKMWQGES